ncbi:MAG: hydroxymethylglutaryl-CoA lyase [Gammaproteobacteria bacterium]|nr:hydroxymethylglutaryl-CoA lyase [Gammaproteobacteria bacterium]NND60340.1 hydroxymethylglutaryl-CoA lyase [Gammaproteobacteria bacterium]
MQFPTTVKVVEVGPRDGLQNEPDPVPTPTKIEFIDRLSRTGLRCIEPTSFVSPRWIPQLADAADVIDGMQRPTGVVYPVLVPNKRGMERALEAGVDTIAIFVAATETFNQRNINASLAVSMTRLGEVAELARQHDVSMRGYVSCVLGCPYEGAVEAQSVATIARELHDMGCYEISLGDTIGVGTPVAARELIETTAAQVPLQRLAVHFHDTRGQALANVLACLGCGIDTVDASVAGLGGCPYADGASGNLATEDLVYMLHGMGIETGIDLDALIAAGRYICAAMGRSPGSRLGLIPRHRRAPRFST